MTLDDNGLKDKANEGRDIIREVLAEQVEIKEEQMLTSIVFEIQSILKSHDVDEEDIDEELVESRARNIMVNVRTKNEDIQDCKDLRSNLSFMPHVNLEAFERLADKQED